MSNYELLLFCEKHNFDVEIKEKKSSMYGCCNTYGDKKIKIFIGNNIAYDKIVTPAVFNEEFEIVKILD